MSMPQVDGTPAFVHSGLQVFTAVAVTGLPGAVAATRWVGGTVSGAPESGTFAAGDFVIDQSGAVWICTVAGTPGSWASTNSTSQAIALAVALGG